ncbi:MAG: hypothetical protein U0Q03_00175 [Acidimicrobiales bacterium]
MMIVVSENSPADVESGTARRTKYLVALLAVVIGVGIGVVTLPSSDGEVERVAVHGVYVLVDPTFSSGSVEGEWMACSGIGRYDDFVAGVEVSLTDELGVESTGKLRNVQASDAALLEQINDANGFFDDAHIDGRAILAGLDALSEKMCVMLFDLRVPAATTYDLKVRDWVDRPITYERLEEKGFTLLLVRGTNTPPQ